MPPRSAFAASSLYVGKRLSERGRRAFLAAADAGTTLILDAYGGAINRPHRADTAFPHRDERFSVQVLSYTDIPTARARVKQARALIAPYGSGAYANYGDPDLADAAARLLRREPPAAAADQGRGGPGEPVPPRPGDQVIGDRGADFDQLVQLQDVGVASSARSRARCDPGSAPAALVPWTPTMPPPGQSVSVSDVALVTNASGP